MQSVDIEKTQQHLEEWSHSHCDILDNRKLVITVNAISVVLGVLGGYPTFLPMVMLVTAGEFVGLYPGEGVNIVFLTLYAFICLSCFAAGIYGAFYGVYEMIFFATLFHCVALLASIAGLFYGTTFWASIVAFLFLVPHILLLHEMDNRMVTSKKNAGKEESAFYFRETL